MLDMRRTYDLSQADMESYETLHSIRYIVIN